MGLSGFRFIYLTLIKTDLVPSHLCCKIVVIHHEHSRRWIRRSDSDEFCNEVLQRSDHIFPLQVRLSLPQASYNAPGKKREKIQDEMLFFSGVWQPALPWRNSSWLVVCFGWGPSESQTQTAAWRRESWHTVSETWLTRWGGDVKFWMVELSSLALTVWHELLNLSTPLLTTNAWANVRLSRIWVWWRHINWCVCGFSGVLFEPVELLLTLVEHVLSQVGDSLSVLCISDVVLDEDGTVVDTEGFFQALPENSVLMVLQKDQKWTPDTVRMFRSSRFNH